MLHIVSSMESTLVMQETRRSVRQGTASITEAMGSGFRGGWVHGRRRRQKQG